MHSIANDLEALRIPGMGVNVHGTFLDAVTRLWQIQQYITLTNQSHYFCLPRALYPLASIYVDLRSLLFSRKFANYLTSQEICILPREFAYSLASQGVCILPRKFANFLGNMHILPDRPGSLQTS